jgi:hypothetical protein
MVKTMHRPVCPESIFHLDTFRNNVRRFKARFVNMKVHVAEKREIAMVVFPESGDASQCTQKYSYTAI